ncbi:MULTISPECIES: hypothetical protein [unclassified Romboutsia]|nr:MULTISPECIES: hypothetical protein [unclassified Romboutsia]MDB8803793.1 hypothetical protein [Romboutsia sp. 1001216sp1]MDB8806857.1 hypothetical protein [Romboutsia sp. 1001216sp1]MDB8809440.1 hypothetical protein [Romboutsia sp. 1001216sp1]MDB8815189.1 hypothetical protein [Romboutsia sp. 1001216sp1]MDB8817882.1 hypothetical protein [Romboutsia sp. 1001216sp1]
MNIDLIFKIVMAIVLIGITIKAIKFLGGLVFKIALVLFIILLVYRMFI